MKKKVIVVAFWIMGCLLSFFFYYPSPIQAYPLDYQIKAEVSSSVETLQIFYLLKNQSGYSQCEFENTIFKKLTLEWFSQYTGHKAVQDFIQSISTKYTQQELIRLFSDISFTTSGLFDLSDPSISNDQTLSTWMKDVNSFLEESQSTLFFDTMLDYYNLLPTTLSPSSSFMTTLHRMMSFFNVAGCKVVLTPTLMHQYYLIDRSEQKQLSFTIILGLQSIQNGYISFTTSDLQQELLYTLLPNQCLSFSLQSYQPNIEKLSHLWSPIQKTMQQDKIDTWSQAFQEHLRISILYKLFPETFTRSLFSKKTESGYQYLPFTAGIIEEYLLQRPDYQSFDSLMTKVLFRFSNYPA